MPQKILLLSGRVSSGKSSLARGLCERHRCALIKTHKLIAEATRCASERRALQRAGDRLDKATNGTWIAKHIGTQLLSEQADVVTVVDAVRRLDQIEAIRNAFGNRVTHVHLFASLKTLKKRHRSRESAIDELRTYAEVHENRTERDVDQLEGVADIVVDTDRCTPDDIVVRVAGRLGFYGRAPERLVDVLVGGQYGSEGKGHVASYLAPEYDVLVRVGGPNAGHKVFEQPSPQTFHHLPSGTHRTESRRSKIVLGAGAVLWVPTLEKEIAECQLSVDRLSIDPNAMIIDPSDRIEEGKHLTTTIASTGQGVGIATSRKVLRTAAQPPVQLAKDIEALRPYIRDTCELLADACARGERVLLEGTQGTGLSLHHGRHPYVTSRDTSVSGCLAESGIAPSRVRRTIMVCRTYPIRVQNPDTKGATSGPMISEISWKEISRRSGVPRSELEDVEKTTTTKRRRRVGEFDWSLLRRAASLNGPTDVALTFADYLTIKNRQARRFEQLSTDTIRFIEEIERVSASSVSLIATRFHYRSIIDRRSWF